MKTQILIVAMVFGAALSSGSPAMADDNGKGRMVPDFATLDADGNGSLTLEELQSGPAARFAAADTDGDGGLSATELAALGAKDNATRAARMLERLDENEDGLLQADEMPARRGGDRAQRMFDHVDADEDGVITAEEFDAMKERGGRRGHGGRGHGGKGDRG